MRTNNLFTTNCPVCHKPMVVQADGQLKRSHGGACRKEMRAHPGRYHWCNTRLCTGRKFDELKGRMLCEEEAYRSTVEYAEEQVKLAKEREAKEIELPKVKRAEVINCGIKDCPGHESGTLPAVCEDLT